MISPEHGKRFDNAALLPLRASRESRGYLLQVLCGIMPYKMGNCVKKTEQIVSDVASHSPAERAGICRGDRLLAINGAPVIDLVDYTALTAETDLILTVCRADGDEREISVKKELYEPLGLSFATSLMDKMRTCRNRCVFCFIDQMPKGGRTSLHVKDDDWRLSFIMGNYVTLTNVDDAELERMIARRVSPLYISVHATDPEVRRRIMGAKHAGRIMEQLNKLKNAGIRFHLQVVACPGLNDGDVLRRTIRDIETLLPAAESLAIVPVGLTNSREGLYPLRCYSKEEACGMIETIETMQERFLKQYGTRFVFLSDEWYCIAGKPLPDYDAYEDFSQIENGVGLLRLFEGELLDALEGNKPLPVRRDYVAASGVSAAPFMQSLMRRLEPYNVFVEVVPIENRYFGPTVTVSGLITGRDLTDGIREHINGRPLLIPHAMLREQDAVFLDDMTLTEAETLLHTRILPHYDAASLIGTVFGSENE